MEATIEPPIEIDSLLMQDGEKDPQIKSDEVSESSTPILEFSGDNSFGVVIKEEIVLTSDSENELEITETGSDTEIQLIPSISYKVDEELPIQQSRPEEDKSRAETNTKSNVKTYSRFCPKTVEIQSMANYHPSKRKQSVRANRPLEVNCNSSPKKLDTSKNTVDNEENLEQCLSFDEEDSFSSEDLVNRPPLDKIQPLASGTVIDCSSTEENKSIPHRNPVNSTSTVESKHQEDGSTIKRQSCPNHISPVRSSKRLRDYATTMKRKSYLNQNPVDSKSNTLSSKRKERGLRVKEQSGPNKKAANTISTVRSSPFDENHSILELNTKSSKRTYGKNPTRNSTTFEKQEVADGNETDKTLGDDGGDTIKKEKPKRREYTCDDCGVSFPLKRELKLHKPVHGVEAGHRCSDCGKVYKKKSTLKQHVKDRHSPPETIVIICDYCGKQFNSKSKLLKHQETHTEKKLSSCSECKESFDNGTILKEHQKEHSCEEEAKQFECSVCNKKFASKQNCARHLDTHAPFTCPVCGKLFDKFRNHEQHLHSHSQSFTCTLCDRTLQTQEGLKHHVRLHMIEKSFQCDKCDKAFYTMRSLDLHTKARHIAVRPFPCSVCSKSFVLERFLVDHMFVHSGVKQFKCADCGKKFFRREILKLHQRRQHTNVKSFACDFCSNTYTAKHSLMMHVRKHHDVE